MADNYDGSIRIDTAINTAPLDNGLGQIEDKIKGLAQTVGLAFGVKELIDFGKRSVDAASDLTEAQNVVDTAFGTMSYKMEQFASTALDVYGISELTAKNMGSTYMAMAKGMGVATDAASDMAVTLTGRLSDIMSFYNKTQSEVDTIGRALITGETEPLKAIGVVMTQTNLSAYAMAQGFSKTYTEMSSNEQLLVRYKYFLEQTSLAQGDFAKTSEGWANQTRLLSERLNEFMTNLGGLIINTFTPALQFANEAVSFLNELFFGGNDNAEDASAVKNAEAVTDEVTAMGTAAEKSEKKLNNLLSGFDELHIISGAKTDENTEIEGAGIDTSDLLGVDLEADTETAKSAAKKYREIINEIYLAFKTHPLTKVVEDIIEKLGEFFGFFNNGEIDAGKLTKSLMDILSAILAYKAVTGIIKGVTSVDKALLSLSKTSTTFGAGFGNLIGLITAHPVAAATIGLTALAIGIYKLNEELNRQRIAAQFGDISISLEEMSELTSPINSDIDRIATAFQENQSKINNARDNFIELSDAINETTEALKFSKSADDLESFTKQVDEYIDAALDFTNAKNDTSALMKLYMSDGKIDETEQAVLDSIEELNGSITSKIEVIRAQIHAVTQAAAEESRKLTESEIENIKHLYEELAQITSTQGDIEASGTWERMISRAYTYDSYEAMLDEIEKAREQSEGAMAEIEKAQYNLMASQILDRRANGASEEEIEEFRENFTKSIDNSLNGKRRQSLEYELKLLNAYNESRFGLTEKSALDEVTNSYFTADEDKEKFKQYYDLFKNAQLSGAGDAEIEKLTEMIVKIGDEKYLQAISAIASELGRDKSYGKLGTERQKVITELSELGYDGTSEFCKSVEDVIKSSDIIDGTAVISDVSEFTGLGTDSGKAYVDALTDYISKASEEADFGFNFSSANEYIRNKYNNSSDTDPLDRFTGGELQSKYSAADLLASTGAMLPGYSPLTEQKPTTLEVRIYNNDEKVIEGPVPIGKNSSFIADNGKSSRWRGY